jgi:hypothetical protein
LKGVTGPDSGYDLMTLDVDENPDLAAEYKVSPNEIVSSSNRAEFRYLLYPQL